MNSRAAFDVGPLSWVKGEIDTAMKRGLEALGAFAAGLAGGAPDLAQLKSAQAHLHQAHGALSIVGLNGVTRVTEELEGLLGDLEKDAGKRSPSAIAIAERAFRDTLAFLEELLGGAPYQPLRLLPIYSGLIEARGGGAVDPTDLYFPDLKFRPPPRAKSPLSLHPEEAKQYLREQRARYQRGLLKFLKNDPAGAEDMRAAVEAIELAQGLGSQRVFWWVALGFFEALVHGALPEDVDARRLCNRTEQQIRRLVEGSQNVAERLMREALYCVARAKPASEHLRLVKDICRLAGTVPGSQDEVEAALDSATLRAARELLAQAKDGWNKYASGHPSSLSAVCGASRAFKECVAALGQPDMARLAAQIASAADWLAQDPSRMSEALALEAATALLLAENGLENVSSLGPEFAEQSVFVCSRLAACMEGRLIRTAPEIPLIDEMSRRAQQRLLTEQLVADMQANLRQIEQVLDGFFRDPSRRGALASIDRPLLQLEHAFDMLGEMRAGQALAQCAGQIRGFAAQGYAPRQEDFESVAQTLSGLGFYVEALARGAADFDQAMRPLSAAPVQEAEPAQPVATVEAQLAEQHKEAQKLVVEWKKKPTDTWLKQELQRNLAAIQKDAGLVADAKLEAAASEALRALEGEQAMPMEPEVAQALDQLAPEVQAPSPSPEAALLAEASGEAVDAELLAVYLEEADEVLGTIAQHLERLRAQAADHEALVTVRRGFHTLKGSGRMVGLARLGEAAWAVEQTLNLWLQEDRAASAPLLDLVAAAHDYFAEGVIRLKSGGASGDERSLVALAESVRQGEAVPIPRELAEAPPVETLQEPAAAPEPAAAQGEFVEIGGQPVSVTLYTIFSGEAHMHLGTLKEEYETLKVHGVITDAMIRAAHTLAGIAGTVQLNTLRDLAAAFERALSTLSLAPLSEDEEALVEQTTETLEQMVSEALAMVEPTPAQELIERLEYIASLSPAAPQMAALERAADEMLLPEEEAALERATDEMLLPEEEAALHAPAPAIPAASVPPPAPAVPFAAAGPSAPAAPAPPAAKRPPQAGALTGAVELEELPPERRQRRIKDEIDPQLLPVFLEEANELIPAASACLREWRAQPGEAGRGQSLQRLLHTLKGSARMAGAMALGELTHHMETRIERALALDAVHATFFDELETSMDRMGLLFERVQTLSQVAQQPAAPAAGPPAPAQAPAAAPGPSAQRSAVLRVRAELIDSLVNEAGEVSIARSRIEGEMRSLKTAMRELTDNVSRLRRQLREIEIQAESQMQSRLGQAQGSQQGFDPLEFDRFTRFQELARMMAESVNDVHTVHQNLISAVDTTDAALASQARLNRDLQQDLMRVRMVPLSSLAERMHRIVRQTAKDLGKRASLDLRGAQVELDRSVLERITAPFEHMLRNAVTHGIEPPAERAAAGKPAIGEIRLDVSQEGNEVVLSLSDDGAGLPLERIVERAVAMGITRSRAALSEAEIADLIFLPGFSTATQVTEIAGRGVGLDVVKSEIASLGGRIALSFERGRGTRFVIYLPLTLAVTQAVLVKSGARTFAIPTVMVEQVQHAHHDSLAQARETRQAKWQARRYPFYALAELLDLAEARPEEKRARPLLFLRSGANSIALAVDEIVASNQEIVVKAIGPQLARVPGVTGATVLGSGEITLIINPVQLALRKAQAATPAAPAAAKAPVQPAQRTVMVVDDSLTVRKVTGRLLERQGYRVVTARDGVEAMEGLQELLPEVMLVDIEMPRMDGFELTRAVRADARLAKLPIIIITSRAAEKHQQYAKDIGANVYLGKPYPEEELLRHIAAFVATGRAAG